MCCTERPVSFAYDKIRTRFILWYFEPTFRTIQNGVSIMAAPIKQGVTRSVVGWNIADRQASPRSRKHRMRIAQITKWSGYGSMLQMPTMITSSFFTKCWWIPHKSVSSWGLVHDQSPFVRYLIHSHNQCPLWSSKLCWSELSTQTKQCWPRPADVQDSHTLYNAQGILQTAIM